jgi:hypothetical protein
MTSCYLVNHVSLRGRESNVISEIENINPDIIIGLCLEEFAYHYIFDNFLELIQPYLLRTNKTMKLIVPYIDNIPVPNNIIVEDSYGYYHWACGSVVNSVVTNLEFKFTDDVKLFTNYNNNAKYQRAMLVDEFVKNNLLKDGIVTLIQPEMLLPDNSAYVYKHHDGSKLVDEMDFVLNAKYEYNAGFYPKSYLNGYVDIVSESTYGPGEFFITEKTAKPIGVLKPFLVYSAPGVHRYLHEKYNLEYYTELFDYSFDEELDIQKRIDGIVQNLLRLRQLSKDELLSMHYSIRDKLIHNRTKYLEIKTNEVFVPESLKFLKHDDVKLYGDIDASILIMMGIQ